ncbi:MAG: DnaJ domain-containing protein [Mizugakiibacter sp.]|uniref:DnaJ domain-containing protein n=1 Tax=Mizugakiibacter sp. TaxID=1972610 RepID=UPI0031C98718|nr:hypothetical protein [Xanthomonadaceae bacterium]
MDDRLELLQAYAHLGLAPGSDYGAVEARYRARVMALHPDRHPRNAHDPDASAALAALAAARRRLRDHQLRFGRLPHAAELEPAPAPPRAASPRPPHRRPRRGRALAALALLALGIWSLTEFGRPVRTPTAPAPATTDAPSATDGPTPPPRETLIRVGSPQQDVRALLGVPTFARGNVWEYGPSRIEFDAGRVSGWYSSPLAPLPVDEHRPLGVRDPLDAR